MTRTLKPLLLCALILTLMGGCRKMQEEQSAWQNPFPESSPMHDPADEVARKLLNEPRYVSRLTGLGPAEARVRGEQLTRSGLHRVPLSLLERRAELLGQVLEKQSIADCAAVARGNPDASPRSSDRIMATLATLPQPVIREWLDLGYQATLAELQQHPLTQVSETQVDDAYLALIKLLPDQERERLLDALRDPPAMSDNEACWFARTLFAYQAKLPQPHRGHFAWYSTL